MSCLTAMMRCACLCSHFFAFCLLSITTIHFLSWRQSKSSSALKNGAAPCFIVSASVSYMQGFKPWINHCLVLYSDRCLGILTREI
jgi:hypothetical protein